MVRSDDSGGGFSMVEHPMSAHALAAPLHRHSREDEYSYIVAGRVGALLGEEVVVGAPGDLIFKPRHQWHTFWNAGDEPARLLEIVSRDCHSNLSRVRERSSFNADRGRRSHLSRRSPPGHIPSSSCQGGGAPSLRRSAT